MHPDCFIDFMQVSAIFVRAFIVAPVYLLFNHKIIFSFYIFDYS